MYRAQCRASGAVVVLKVYDLTSICELYQFQIFREIRLHSRLQHENVVQVRALCYTPAAVCQLLRRRAGSGCP